MDSVNATARNHSSNDTERRTVFDASAGRVGPAADCGSTRVRDGGGGRPTGPVERGAVLAPGPDWDASVRRERAELDGDDLCCGGRAARTPLKNFSRRQLERTIERPRLFTAGTYLAEADAARPLQRPLVPTQITHTFVETSNLTLCHFNNYTH